MVQRTVLKVDLSCRKCKKKILKGVSGLEGVDKIEVDAAKETLTVTGNADPYEIIAKCRKVGKCAEVVTVGPPPPPPEPEEKKKPVEKEPEEKKHQYYIPYYPYNNCEMSIMRLEPSYCEPAPTCSIM